MKSFLLLIGFICIVKGNHINYDLKLINEYFYVNFDDNSIIFNNYYSDNIKINFEYISDITENNKQDISFKYFIKEVDEFNKYNILKAVMKNDNIYYEMSYESFYYNNYMDVFIKTNSNIIMCISFDKQIINYNGKNILEVKDYIISTDDNITIDRFGNYFYFNFTSNDNLYKFKIKYISNYYNDEF